jgi:flagellar basal body-associated protein FliL
MEQVIKVSGLDVDKVPAAPAPQKAAVARKAAPVAKVENTQPSAAPVARPATTVVLPVAARSGGQIQTNITKVAPKPVSQRFALKYSTENAMNLDSLENKVPNEKTALDSEIRATDNIGLTYKFTDDSSATIQAEFYHTWFGDRDRLADGEAQYNSSGAGFMGPVKLILANSKIASLKGGLTLDGFLRYDAPTSEAAQRDGELGNARLNIGLGRSFGKLDVKVSFMPRYYFQQYNVSEIKNAKGQGNLNKQVRFYEMLDVTYNFTDKLSLTLSGGVDQTITHDDGETKRDAVRKDRVLFYPEVDYAFSENFVLAVGFNEETNTAKLPDYGWVPLEVAEGRETNEAFVRGTFKF